VEGRLVTRPLARLVLTVGAVAAVLLLLHRWAGTAVGSPSSAEPAVLVVALVRQAAILAGWYVLAMTLAGGLARVARVRPAVRLADRCTVPGLRRLLDVSFGVTVLAATASPAAWAEPPPRDESPPPTMVRLPDSSDAEERPPPPESTTTTVEPTTTSTAAATVPTTTTTTTAVVPTGPPATTGPSSPTSTTTTTSTSATTAPVPTTAPPTRPPPPSAPSAEQPSRPAAPAVPTASSEQWTVHRGDHFWSIAQRVLAQAWQRPAGDAETDPYWRALVDANRHRLADPDNADLLFAGQVLTLPPPPPAPP
jgi:hypothetical protein